MAASCWAGGWAGTQVGVAHAGPDMVAIWHALLLLLVVLVCVSLASFSHLQRQFWLWGGEGEGA